MNPIYKTALIGLGKIASLYEEDLEMQKNVKYSTHTKVLIDHPSYNLIMGVDPNEKSRDYFSKQWGISEVYGKICDVKSRDEIEIAVICTPPHIRKSIIDEFPNLKAVLLEKPVADNIENSKAFIELCKKRKIKVQVNLTRRSDSVLKKLSSGMLNEFVGDVQAVFGVYGNGLHNNGIHMIDMVRMLFGNIIAVQATNTAFAFQEGPLRDDSNFSFQLFLQNNLNAIFQPIRFSNYRENSLDIYGSKARLELVHEGLHMVLTPSAQCRSYSPARELASDRKEIYSLDYGNSLYNLYDNLIQNIENGIPLDCSGETALQSTEIVESIFTSFENSGQLIKIING